MLMYISSMREGAIRKLLFKVSLGSSLTLLGGKLNQRPK